MEYSIKQIADMAGISTRTLRYYDEIGLLLPAGTSEAGYRLYGAKEVDRLQEILFFRELDMSIEEIRSLISSKNYDREAALQNHRKSLCAQRDRLERLILTVEKTIKNVKGELEMTDKEKFEGFKQKQIEKNEELYGKEIRSKYGDKTVDASNKKYLEMSECDYLETEALAEKIIETLHAAMDTGKPDSELAQKACALHKEWLCRHWDKYSPEAHAGLGQMYVDDPRFADYYDKQRPGTAKFLRDALLIFAATQK
ncbi:MerR family transcriptional regulator [Eubacteriales bacterium OttesenSCG-928-K08]|nr:MerR family transcriptional regulator [Eubacteriales bacterium OttesenSCG-928-K08]